jgi:hypothetical protein
MYNSIEPRFYGNWLKIRSVPHFLKMISDILIGLMPKDDFVSTPRSYSQRLFRINIEAGCISEHDLIFFSKSPRSCA